MKMTDTSTCSSLSAHDVSISAQKPSKKYCLRDSLNDAFHGKQSFLIVLFATGFLLIFWSQVIHVPFWQDDYLYLLDAKIARLEGRSWLFPFFPPIKVSFWRPLGMETYWRFVETFLGGNVTAAHFSNVVLLILSAAAVGWFVVTLLGLLALKRDPVISGAAAAFLYGVHASHFLPAAWVAAANDSFCILFSALTLRYWLVVSTSFEGKRPRAIPILLLCFLMALFSRDVAFVLPSLGFLLTLWLWPHHKPSTTAWTTGALCIGISLIWLTARGHFTLPADPAYELRLGSNVIRNMVCLVLFFFNTPFEALRYFFFVKASVSFALWGIACFLLQSAVFAMLLHIARGDLSRKTLFILIVFFIIGCAPYFLLSRNCYPYYISLGLFTYAILGGISSQRSKIFSIVLILAVLSSSFSTLGNYFLESPSHIGRARWAERQLARMAALRETQPQLFSGSLQVVVEDMHKFMGFGVDGLAYRLGVDRRNIAVLPPGDRPSPGKSVLVVPKDGDVFIRTEEQRVW